MKNKSHKPKKSNGTVQQQTNASTATPIQTCEQGVSNASGTINQESELFGFMRSMAASMKETAAQLLAMNITVSSLQSELQNLRQRIDEARTELDCAEKRQQETSRALAALAEEVAELKAENWKLKSNDAAFKIVIYGIPNGCDDMSTFGRIAALLNVSGYERQIANYYRINIKDKDKPKPLVISFNSIVTRNLFLNNRKNRTIFYSDIGFDDNTNKIFVNEYLTKETLCLLNNAKLLKREYEFDFVWPKNGIVYARKKPNENCIRINNIEDIARIIGKN
jgi:hypothetical protein